jgi:hypothetical protein
MAKKFLKAAIREIHPAVKEMPEGDKKDYIDVNICIDIVCGDTRNE